jgi:hypothetical protein
LLGLAARELLLKGICNIVAASAVLGLIARLHQAMRTETCTARHFDFLLFEHCISKDSPSE